MGDEPLGDVTHAEQRELDALRRRAYGPDADILDDAAALGRLRQFEDRLRLDRLSELTGASTDGDAVDAPADRPAAAGPTPPESPRAPRLRLALIAGGVAAATLAGVIVWNASHSEPSVDVAVGVATTPAATDEERAAEYERYLDGLRADVLSLPGSEQIANRMLHDELRPYGILYGRAVGSGPTVDREFCMIIADLPASSVTCIPLDETRAEPVSVTLPSWYSESDSDAFTGLGQLVSYTLMPGGSVVAVPAD